MGNVNKKRELRKISGVGIMLLIVTLVVSAFKPYYSIERTVIFASGDENVLESRLSEIDDNIEAEVIEEVNTSEKSTFSGTFNWDKTFKKYITIPKPDDKKRIVTITDNYVYHTIFLDIEGDFMDYYHPDLIKRVSGDKVYQGEPQYESVEPYLMAYLNDKLSIGEEEEEAYDEELVKERKYGEDTDPLISIKKNRIVGALNGTRLELTCNRIYYPELFEDDKNFYIVLRRPKDVFKKILVLDAGHGGKHPGTSSMDGKIFEKDTTLKVVQMLKKLFDKNGEIKVYYSRLNDATVYLRPRVDLANETEADFFVSIHNNAFFTRHASGTEVLFNEKNDVNRMLSERLAELILDNVTNVLKTRKRGIREGSEKYVIGHTNMPSALVEIGYLTNEKDLGLILNDKKMKLCAKAIYDSIMTVYEEMEE